MEFSLTSRLSSHGLETYQFTTPAEVVRHYGAIQAQDIGQATWVIGSRIENSTEDIVRYACRDGSIVRTWPMRGTLHYMDPRNVKWMVSLCASKTLSGFPKRREFLGITDTHAERSLEIMDQVLRGGKSLTRTELSKALEEHGIPMQTQWMYHLSCYAGTLGLICFGPPTEKEETFVLTSEWVKESINLNHDEQLAELAEMYFRGHSPATIDDLAWWCGLGKTECRKAVSMIEHKLEKLEYNGKEYYIFPSSGAYEGSKKSDTWILPSSEGRNIRLIGGFDEYFLGYKDRSLVANIEHYSRLFTSNGIFFPLIIQDGRAIGSWKREFKKEKIFFTLDVIPGYSCDMDTLKKECERYTKFSGYQEFEIK
ncbi:AlkZ family DNA glycosylase [Candidatus Gracilibacteria bacterium]|nr:AlkZ family DNA glycosylase [Candidatus Gracilibacteria bacterium]